MVIMKISYRFDSFEQAKELLERDGFRVGEGLNFGQVRAPEQRKKPFPYSVMPCAVIWCGRYFEFTNGDVPEFKKYHDRLRQTVENAGIPPTEQITLRDLEEVVREEAQGLRALAEKLADIHRADY